MAKFLTPIIVKKIGPQLWELREPLIFLSDKYPGKFIAPVGMITNFASIPRIFWNIFPPTDNYDAAAVIHDGGCHHDLLTEKGERIHTVKTVIDNIFYEALIVCGVETVRAKLMYALVHKYGEVEETPWLT